MGPCCSRNTGKAKLYSDPEEQEDHDLLLEMKPHFDKLADGDKGVPLAQLSALYDAVTGHEQPLTERETTAAGEKLDPDGTGYFSLSSFIRWFKIPSQPGDELPAPEPEVHENVRRGLKDDGLAEGTEKYDAEMAEERARKQAEAEAELRAMKAGREASAMGSPPAQDNPAPAAADAAPGGGGGGGVACKD